MIRAKGMGIVGFAVLHSLCVARKIHRFLSIHRGGTVRYKEASARGLITPLQSLGPASRSGILTKTWSTLNLERIRPRAGALGQATSENFPSRQLGEYTVLMSPCRLSFPM